MLGYLIVIVIMTGWYFLCRQSRENQDKNFLIGITVIMTLFYGLRGEDVGHDTTSYIEMFLEDGAQPLKGLWAYMWNKKSPAYVLSEWIFYKILPYPQLWLLVTSAFFFIVFSRFVEKNSVDPYFSYLIFFTIFGTFQTTGIRQSCAMAILLLAFESIKEKRLFRYLLLVGFAYLFHKSSIVFLPFYLIGRRRVTLADIPAALIAIALIYLNRTEVFEYIKGFTSYDHYSLLDHEEPINFSIMIYGATLLSLALCVALTYLKRHALEEQHQQEYTLAKMNSQTFDRRVLPRTLPRDVLLQELRNDDQLMLYAQYANAMLLASLFMPLVAVNGAVRRIVMYFAMFMVLLIPKAFQQFLDSKSRRIAKVLFGSFLMYLLLQGIEGSAYVYTLLS